MSINDNNTVKQPQQPKQPTPGPQGQAEGLFQFNNQPTNPLDPNHPHQPSSNPTNNKSVDDFEQALRGRSTALRQFDWINIGDINPYQVNTTIASHELTALEKALKEFLDEYISRDLEVTVIPVDKTSRSNLAVSLLILAVKPKNQSKTAEKTVAFHTLLIEGSIEQLPVRFEHNRQNHQIEVLTLTSDLCDRTLFNIATQEVQSVFPDHRPINAYAEVIPRSFDMSERDNIHRVVVNSVMACQVHLAKDDKTFVDLNLANAKQHTAYLTQTVKFNKGIEEDVYGLPVRADITMDMIAQANVDQNNPQWRAEQKIITHATGYIELIYNDVNNQFGIQGYNPTPQFGFQPLPGQPYPGFYPQPIFQPELVLTQLLNAKIQTLPGVLLALINASAITENYAWLPALMPDHANGREDMNDIGNIGLDISLKNDGTFEKLKTTPDQFTYHDLFQLAKQYFHEGVVISLDIPESSATTWMYRIIQAAAYGMQEQRDALFQSAMILTNGHFETFYHKLGGTGIMAYCNENRITLGYYNSPEGKRDKRDFDYLAAAGFAGKKGDRDEVMAYTDTFNAIRQMTTNERLDLRRRLESSYLPGLVYTGFADRVSLEAAFVQALKLGAAQCGYTVSTQQPLADNMMGTRANAGYVSGCILDQHTSGIFKPYQHSNRSYYFNNQYPNNQAW